MIDFIINIVTPIFTKMGASAADIASTVQTLSGYIYAILSLLVIAVVIMIATHWVVKKGTRHVARWSTCLCWLLIVGIIANVICFGPMQTTLNSALADDFQLSEETVNYSEALVKEVAEEGIVLAKNDGRLPLSEETTKLNVFGWASTNPIYGGTGSGSSDASSCVGILKSLTDAGYTLNDDLSDMYLEYCNDRPTISMQEQDWTLPEPTADYYTEDLLNDAKEFSDTAVIFLARSAGEGADLPKDMYSVIHGTYNQNNDASVDALKANYLYMNASYTNNGNYDDFDEGETYLELSNTEEAMVEMVCNNFDNVIVIVNASNTMELSWVDKYQSISSVLLVPGTGVTGMTAVGEIINGTINPSGRTVDTFVYDLTAAPTFHNMGDMQYSNLDAYRAEIKEADPAFEGAIGFVNYIEGIYVGYKYYETAYDEGVIDYDAMVQYPFGYGLSYTTFEQQLGAITDNGNSVSFDVTVTNVGAVAGKDVVQVYFNPPYTNGGIEKASANLVQFEKTQLLEPGEKQVINFTINKEDFASYDEGIKVTGGGYILEAGDYKISIRQNSHDIIGEEILTISDDIIYTEEEDGMRASDSEEANNKFADVAGDVVYLSRRDGFANYEEAVAAPSEEAYVLSDENIQKLISNANYDSTKEDNSSDEMPVMGAKNGIVLADMTGLSYDDPKWESLLDELTYEEMQALIGFGGWMTAAVPSIKKEAGMDPDGPAGLSSFMSGRYGTAYTAEVLLAMTWNKELAAKVGDGIAQEFVEAGCEGWYGPAMNTHRSPFSGRNFEYYSEDAILAGYMAAAEVAAAESKGVLTYIKHFALNDQETSRCSFLLTWANEQSIREIYLKPFELAIKEGNSVGVMSSFNFLGTTPVCADPVLLNDVLRGEWNFVGVVNTDFFGGYGYMNAERCIANGNDMMLGLGTSAYATVTNTSATMVLKMRNACHNILYAVANHGSYVTGVKTDAMQGWMKTLIAGDAIGIILILGIEGIVIIRYRRKQNRKVTDEA